MDDHNRDLPRTPLSLSHIPSIAMNPSSTCYTIVHDDLLDAPTSQELRNALQKGSDEVKLETMRRIIVGTLNGQSHVQYSWPTYTRPRLITSLPCSCPSSNMSCLRETSKLRRCCTSIGSE